jgi:Ca2+/Na+ antiporter
MTFAFDDTNFILFILALLTAIWDRGGDIMDFINQNDSTRLDSTRLDSAFAIILVLFALFQCNAMRLVLYCIVLYCIVLLLRYGNDAERERERERERDNDKTLLCCGVKSCCEKNALEFIFMSISLLLAVEKKKTVSSLVLLYSIRTSTRY